MKVGAIDPRRSDALRGCYLPRTTSPSCAVWNRRTGIPRTCPASGLHDSACNCAQRVLLTASATFVRHESEHHCFSGRLHGSAHPIVARRNKNQCPPFFGMMS
eukprot:4826059-Pleurochrysis_carterae.AAC.4